MRKLKLAWTMCAISLTLICCGAVSAQTPAPQTLTEDVRLIEELDNGRGFIVRINGEDFRAVSVERWRELLVAEVKDKNADAVIKVLNERAGYLAELIATYEKRADTDARQIQTLTAMLQECQQQLAQRRQTGKGAIVKELAQAGWSLFMWWRAVK